MESKDYNFIYSELVQDDDDILGIIAYSIYKRQKIEFIENFKEQNKVPPTDKDLKSFNQLSNSQSQLQSYKLQAIDLSERFLEVALEAKAEEIEKFYENKYTQEVRNYRPSFWSGVAQSMVGSVVFVFVIGFFIFMTWSAKLGVKQVIEGIFNVKIVTIDSNVDVTLHPPEPSLPSTPTNADNSPH